MYSMFWLKHKWKCKKKNKESHDQVFYNFGLLSFSGVYECINAKNPDSVSVAHLLTIFSCLSWKKKHISYFPLLLSFFFCQYSFLFSRLECILASRTLICYRCSEIVNSVSSGLTRRSVASDLGVQCL